MCLKDRQQRLRAYKTAWQKLALHEALRLERPADRYTYVHMAGPYYVETAGQDMTVFRLPCAIRGTELKQWNFHIPDVPLDRGEPFLVEANEALLVLQEKW